MSTTIPGGTPDPDRSPVDAGRAVTREMFHRVAERLEVERRRPPVSARKEDRRRLYAPCKLSYFVGPARVLQTEDAYLRNVSSGGAGVLIARPMARGDLVEISLELNDGPLFLAGHIAFCRPAEGAVHDIGIQVFHRATTPILPREGDSSVGPVGDWLRRLIETHDPEGRRSA